MCFRNSEGWLVNDGEMNLEIGKLIQKMLDIIRRKERPHFIAPTGDQIIFGEAEENQAVGNLLVIIILDIPLWII